MIVIYTVVSMRKFKRSLSNNVQPGMDLKLKYSDDPLFMV